MAGSMQAADAAGRISALLSLLALRRILAVLQPLLLLLLLPFRWRARQGDAALADAVAASVTASSGKKAKAAVVLRVPAGSPMVCSRRQALVRREAAMRARGRPGGTTSSSPPPAARRCSRSPGARNASSSIKPRALVVVMHGLNEHISEFGSLLVCFYCWLVWPVADDWVLPWIDLAVAWTGLAMVAVMVYMDTCNLLIMLSKTWYEKGIYYFLCGYLRPSAEIPFKGYYYYYSMQKMYLKKVPWALKPVEASFRRPSGGAGSV